MTIINDLITFETADFDGLSDAAKKALTGYLEDYAAHFSNSLTAFVVAARQHAKNLAANDSVTDSILAGLAKADEATLFAVAPLLAKLDSVLNP